MWLKKIVVNTDFVLKNIIPILFLKKEKGIANLLKRNALRLSIVESCTGGLISSRMTDVSGSSAYIFQNFVTYANSAKVKILGVNPQTIEKYGVVSEEVAKEMAEGLLNKYDCTITIATTGVAGPTGGTDEKPVGLICIGVANEKTTKTYSYKASPLLYRRIMKYAFSTKALEFLIDFLKENY